MSKQVLSVADFALILNIVNEKIISYEEYACRRYGKRDDLFIQPANISDKSVQEHLSLDQHYLDLMHLKNSLQKLNIEVETPDVELTHQHEDKGE